MEMYYLVLAIWNREVTLTTIPEKYNKSQCEDTIKFWERDTKDNSRLAWCIPAPKNNICIGGPELGMVKGTKYPCN